MATKYRIYLLSHHRVNFQVVAPERCSLTLDCHNTVSDENCDGFAIVDVKGGKHGEYTSNCSACKKSCKIEALMTDDGDSVCEISIPSEFSLSRVLIDSQVQWRCKAFEGSAPISLYTTNGGCWNILTHTVLKQKHKDGVHIDSEFWKADGWTYYGKSDCEESDEELLVEEGERTNP